MVEKKKDKVYGASTLHVATLYCQILSIHVQYVCMITLCRSK